MLVPWFYPILLEAIFVPNGATGGGINHMADNKLYLHNILVMRDSLDLHSDPAAPRGTGGIGINWG